MTESPDPAGGRAGPVAVSVCVPTYHRPEALERALDRLAALDPPEGGYELIVVDDGSPPGDGVAAALERRAATCPVRLRWRTQIANRGPAAARNVAWRLAEGEWVAFTDDDCRPEPDWLVRLIDEARRSGAGIVEGLTRPDPERAHLLAEPFSRSVAVAAQDEYFRTCNIAYRRDLLVRLDGFDERFRRIGDDTDLGWRAVEAGAAVAFAEQAIVTHDVTVVDWRADLRSRRRWTDTVRVITKHPGARRLAWRPYVFRSSHAPILAGLAALPLAVPRATRAPLLVAGAGLVALDALRRGSRAGAVAQMQRRVGDAYEVMLLAATSVRERTVLL